MGPPGEGIDSATLTERLEDSDHELVDIRPLAAYNGWRLRGEPRGGHLPGATSLPLTWFESVAVEPLLEQRGPTPEQPVTVYGYDAAQVRPAVDALREHGYDELTSYTGFVDEWAADRDRPLERLSRYDQLVSPRWVKAVVGDEPVPQPPAEDVVICHVHFDNPADYDAGHVPGAIPLDTKALEAPPDWNRRPPAELERTLRRHGIRHDTTVVLYGRPMDTPSGDPDVNPHPGHLGAMRAAVILLYAGVDDVRVLNGGLAAWNLAGFDLETGESTPTPVDEFGAAVPERPDLIIDTPEAKSWLEADDKDLVSVRTEEEYDGDTSGYTYISERGHIRGAVFVPSGSDPDHVEPYRNPDETMREYPAVAAMWEREGVDPDRHLAFYCGTGWRSSEAFMHAYLMGWSDVAVYDGGWHVWSSDPDNPTG
ncbi:MAG: rhodanese-like domain-containing protein [Halobacteriales archaeon]